MRLAKTRLTHRRAVWPIALHQVGDDVHGHGEDDGAVVLCRDAAQGLQVAELGRII